MVILIVQCQSGCDNGHVTYSHNIVTTLHTVLTTTIITTSYSVYISSPCFPSKTNPGFTVWSRFDGEQNIWCKYECDVVMNGWCELWAWWTWGHLPNCHNLLSLIDFQLSLKSSKQSTPTHKAATSFKLFTENISTAVAAAIIIDICWLAGQFSPHCPGPELLSYEMYTSRVKNNFNEIIINIPGL